MVSFQRNVLLGAHPDSVVRSIQGGRSAFLGLAPLSREFAGTYYVVVGGPGANVTSRTVTETVTPGVIIDTHPVSQMAALGDNVTFSVVAREAEKAGPVLGLSYSWLKNGQFLAGSANAPTLTLTGVKAEDFGTYSVRVQSGWETTVESFPATLSLPGTTPPPPPTPTPEPPPPPPTPTPEPSPWRERVPVPPPPPAPTPAPPPGPRPGTFQTTAPQGILVGARLTTANQADLLIYLPNLRTALFGRGLPVGTDGTCDAMIQLLRPSATAGSSAVSPGGHRPQANAGETRGRGKFVGDRLDLEAADYAIKVTVAAVAGDVAQAGIYAVSAVNAAQGGVYAFVATNGAAILVAQSAAGAITGGAGVLGVDGSLNVTTDGQATVTASFDAAAGSLNATATGGDIAGARFAGVRSDVVRTDRLANISTRGLAGRDADALMVDFVVAGDGPKPVLIRAVGPTLAGFGVAGALVDPVLTLREGDTTLAVNDDWSGADVVAATSRLGGFPLAVGSRDAVLLRTLPPGAYTAQVSVGSGGPGLAIDEVYDASEGEVRLDTPRLINIATRGRAGVEAESLIAGLVVRGNAPRQVLIRAIGPTLAGVGVPGALADPRLVLRAGETVIAENDDWRGSAIIAAAARRGAFALAADSRDAALLIRLEPGAYPVQVSGAGESTGLALVEIYEIPD